MSKSKILFIIPPYGSITELVSENPNASFGSTRSMPTGVLSIAAYVKAKADADFRVLDLNVELLDSIELGNKIDWEVFLQSFLRKDKLGDKIDIVGISALFNSSLGYIPSIAGSAKKVWPRSLVVAGGEAPTNMCSYIFERAPELDAIALGEGEKPFLGLVLAEDRKIFIEKAPAWTTRKRLHSKESPVIELIDNLDEIPPLEYDLIDFDRYQKVNRFHGTKAGTTVSINFSRGCPHRCNFCSAHTVHGRKMRYLSPSRALDDVRRLRKYGVSNILIEDDLFFGNKKKALEIMRGLINEKFDIEVTNGLSVESMMDEEIVDCLKAAGAKSALLAVESGSERVLREIIRKPFRSLSKVNSAVELLRRKGLYIRANFVIGFPGETRDEVSETINFMKKAGFNWVGVMIASPIAGSELYQFCRDNNLLISDNPEEYHFANSNIKLDHFTPEEITELRYLINLDVNFVGNFDLKNGRFDVALAAFEEIISRFPNHAFAHYCSSICHRGLGNRGRERESLSRYFEIVKNSSHWARYARHFDLPLEWREAPPIKQGEII